LNEESRGNSVARHLTTLALSPASRAFLPDFPKRVQRLEQLKRKLSSCFELAPQAAGKSRRAVPLAGNIGNTGRQKLKNLGVS